MPPRAKLVEHLKHLFPLRLMACRVRDLRLETPSRDLRGILTCARTGVIPPLGQEQPPVQRARRLIEWGWLLLVLLTVKSRFDFELQSPVNEPVDRPWRRVADQLDVN